MLGHQFEENSLLIGIQKNKIYLPLFTTFYKRLKIVKTKLEEIFFDILVKFWQFVLASWAPRNVYLRPQYSTYLKLSS